MKVRASILILLPLALTGWGSRAAAVLDPTLSYYVPQAGMVAAPLEGADAIRFLRACPNNDGGSSLPNNVRIKVVALDGAGVGIPDIPAAEVCVLFNGGTVAQGFVGPGADSIVANGTWNVAPLCPDVTCIEADAPPPMPPERPTSP